MNRSILVCSQELRQVFSEKVVNARGLKSGFAKRLRKFTPVPALWSFVTGFGSGQAKSLADFPRLFTELTGETIEYKAFHDRLSNRRFPEFLRLSLEDLLSTVCRPIVRSKSRYLKRFEDIVVHDGSSYALNDALAEAFTGRFTKISPAAVEVHCTYSLYEGQPIAIAIDSDKEGERQFLPEAQTLRRKLLLVDRGYLDYKYFRAVEEAGGSYISRARDSKFNPKILRCFKGLNDRRSVFGKRLAEIDLPKRNVDLWVQGTSEKGRRYEYRLVLYYVKQKDKHVRLITNLLPNDFPPSIVASLYRLRWQIELLFKECKSYTCLQKFQTRNPHIAEALIWASLLAVAIRRFFLYSAFRGSTDKGSPFIAATLSWTFFRDIAKAAIASVARLNAELRRVLDLLRKLARRTNPHRIGALEVLQIEPVRGYA